MMNSFIRFKNKFFTSDVKKKNYHKFYFFGSIIFLIFVWGIVSYFVDNTIILPSPIYTFQTAFVMFGSVVFWSEIFISFLRGVFGFLLALVVGVFFGLLMGVDKRINSFFLPILILLQTIPVVSWLVLAWLWFGSGPLVVVMIVFFTSVPFIVVNIVKGMDAIDYNLVEMSKLFRVRFFRRVKSLYLPHIVPYLASGAISAFGITWKVVAMAELLVSRDGIGAMMALARVNLEIAQVFVYTFVLVLFGFCSEKLITKIYKKFTKYKNV
jgi:NitT/TauT family transport system permease protein